MHYCVACHIERFLIERLNRCQIIAIPRLTFLSFRSEERMYERVDVLFLLCNHGETVVDAHLF